MNRRPFFNPYQPDFRDLGTIEKHFQSAFRWYENHENQIEMDPKNNVNTFLILWRTLPSLYQKYGNPTNTHRQNRSKAIL